MNQLNLTKKKQSFLPKNLEKLIIVLLILLVGTIIASIAFGSRSIGWSAILDGLFHPDMQDHEALVVRQRIVRTIFSFMCSLS